MSREKLDAFTEVGLGVYSLVNEVVQITRADVEHLDSLALTLPRKRARICAHKNNLDSVHEMIIALRSESYIRPHLHPAKTESFHVIFGRADVVIFDDSGGIRELVRLGDYGSGRTFFYRLAEPKFHTLLIRTQKFVLHEVTNGPFLRDETVYASWAPLDSDVVQVKDYLKDLEVKISEFLAGANL